MDTKNFLDSGLLEAYVLGQTSQTETREIEQLRLTNPAIDSEIRALEDTLERLAESQAIVPPVALKSKIEAKLTFGNAANLQNDEPIKPLWYNNKWTMAASVALLLGSLALNAFFYNNWQKTEQKYGDLVAQNQILAENNEILKASYTSELDIIHHRNIKMVALSTLPDMPKSNAMVYWDNDSKDVYLSAINLPQTSDNQVYQLWAIVNGKPVDAGLIDMKKPMLKMKNFQKAEAFAISLEVAGGSTTQAGPKGKIYVMGAV